MSTDLTWKLKKGRTAVPTLRINAVRLHQHLSDIKDAGESHPWTDASPNWGTRNQLQKIYDEHLLKAASFGFFVVRRHGPCGKRKHKDYDVISDPYGLGIKYKDSRFVWTDRYMHAGELHCTCPCAPRNTPNIHWVVEDVIYDPQSDQTTCAKLESIFSDFQIAIQSAQRKHTRSSIREYLLRAILKLNDLILPQTVDLYIEARLDASVKSGPSSSDFDN